MTEADESARPDALQRAISSSMPGIALAVFDPDLRCLLARGGDLIGLAASVEGAEGSAMEELFGREVTEQLTPFCQAALRGEDVTFDQYVPPLDRYLQIRVSPLSEGPGAPIQGSLISAVDITARVLAQKRTEVLQEELQDSEQLEAVGKLAGGVAHDFNNLLAVILNYALFVSESLPEDSPLQEDLDEIRMAGERGAALTRQLLILSRREVARPEIVDVNVVVANMVKLLHRTLGADISLVTELEEAPLLVEADPGQLEQVLLSLAVNARDAMPDGGELRIRTDSVELDDSIEGVTPGPYLRLTVSDTGVGLPEDAKRRLFDPLQSSRGATGLGLTAVKTVIDGARGHLSVYGEPGIGTTFRIHLPASDRRLTTRQDTADEPDPTALMILIAEDDESVRRMASRILTDAGHSVETHPDGRAALDAFKQNPARYDLLLSDVVMPKMAGRELAQHVLDERPELPVVFMSGYTKQVISASDLHRDGITLIEKPFSVSKLLRVVRTAATSD